MMHCTHLPSIVFVFENVLQLMQAETLKERDRIFQESRFLKPNSYMHIYVNSPIYLQCTFTEIFVALLLSRMRFVFVTIEPNFSIADVGWVQVLRLFVQHHSALLHVSKHAPDCIGFQGAFETRRFLLFCSCFFCLISPPIIRESHSVCRLQPQLHGAAARVEGDERDVDEHFDHSTEASVDQHFTNAPMFCI